MNSPTLTTEAILGPLAPPDTPEVRAVAIVSLNGKATSHGTAGGLGSDFDQRFLQATRHWSDAVVVGAGTVRAENYGGVKVPETIQRERVARDQAAIPPLVVLTKRGELDPDSRLFQDTEVSPIILSGVDMRSTAPAAVVDRLRERGLRRIVLEGGPSLFSQWLEAGTVDVLHLTVAPHLVPAAEADLFPGFAQHLHLGAEFAAVDEAGCIFTRYRLR